MDAYARSPRSCGIAIEYPENGTLFPPEIVAPTFRWDDTAPGADRWLVSFLFKNSPSKRIHFFTDKKDWQPEAFVWEDIKKRSTKHQAAVLIIGFKSKAPQNILSAAQLTIGTSTDSVGDPIFYREVNLPFADAVKDPSRIRWRFGSVGQREAPVVLENLPVCGNCHSFSRDGKYLAMDVDYANDKGSYVITRVAQKMALASSDIITWSDYKRDEDDPTFGLLSQISPDGRYVVSTVKDRSVFVARPDLAFSQLFFPIQGILVVYTKEKQAFHSLSGADSTEYVQSNPCWSPDGQNILFARSKAYKLKGLRSTTRVRLDPEECSEFIYEGKKFLFDVYRVPFNNGRGGAAVPLKGASKNGVSNYFPRYSPDGRWIVFCRSSSYMLLQPDSKLFIMPAEGGEPRRMRCNTSRMNSWHSWSSNSRWLIFASKKNAPFTQLYITHIDENGNDTPPVLLDHLTNQGRAANIPEFVNTAPDAIVYINEEFIDDQSYWRAGKAFEDAGDLDGAVGNFTKAITLNPSNIKAHLSLGNLFEARRQWLKATAYYAKAVAIDSGHAMVHVNRANILTKLDSLDDAVRHYRYAIRLQPKDPLAYYNLGNLYFMAGDIKKAAPLVCKAIDLESDYAGSYYLLGQVYEKMGRGDLAIKNYRSALKYEPDNVLYNFTLANLFKRRGNQEQAITYYNKTLKIQPNFRPAQDSIDTY